MEAGTAAWTEQARGVVCGLRACAGPRTTPAPDAALAAHGPVQAPLVTSPVLLVQIPRADAGNAAVSTEFSHEFSHDTCWVLRMDGWDGNQVPAHSGYARVRGWAFRANCGGGGGPSRRAASAAGVCGGCQDAHARAGLWKEGHQRAALGRNLYESTAFSGLASSGVACAIEWVWLKL